MTSTSAPDATTTLDTDISTSSPPIPQTDNAMSGIMGAGITNLWEFNANLDDSVTGLSLFNPVSIEYVPDRFGAVDQAIHLNNGYLQMPAGVYFDGDFSINAWVNIQSADSFDTLLDCGSFQQGANEVVVMMTGTGGKPKPYLNLAYNRNFVYYPQTQSFALNTWTYLSVTLQGLIGSTYLNGVLASQQSYVNLPTITRSECYIGFANWLYPSSNVANAYIDDLSIYNRALSSDEIVAIMGVNLGTNAPSSTATATATATKTSTSTSTSTKTATATSTSTSTSTSTATATKVADGSIGSLLALNLTLDYFWSFNGDVVDSASSVALGAPFGTRFVADRNGNAGKAIDLSLGYLTMPSAVYFSGDFTVSAWVKVLSVQSYQALLDCGTSTQYANEVAIYLSTYTFNYPEFCFLYNSVGFCDPKSSYTFTLGKWTHLAVVYKYNPGYTITYIDAVPSFTLSGMPSYPIVTRTVCYVGYDTVHNSQPTNAQAHVDDLAIYSKTLSQAQITTIMNTYI